MRVAMHVHVRESLLTTMVCKQCQNCAFINDKQVQNGVEDIGMGQPISS